MLCNDDVLKQGYVILLLLYIAKKEGFSYHVQETIYLREGFLSN